MARQRSRSARALSRCTSSMRGCPRVSVPVLSNTIRSALARHSSARPRVTSRPQRASRVVAAASAAGVASDSAHGQVTTSTASTVGKARARIHVQPVDRNQRRQQQHRTHEPGGDASARSATRGRDGARALEQARDGSQRRVLTHARDPHLDRRSPGSTCRRSALSPRVRTRGRGFTGQQGLVDFGAAALDLTVRRDAFARQHAHSIAGV